ncbi:MAG: DEAD/DEAH box helicase [Verrucomicrobiota bacterium]
MVTSRLHRSYQRLNVREHRRNYQGADSWTFSFHGIHKRRKKILEELLERAARVLERFDQLESSSPESISRKVTELRPRFMKDPVPEEALIEGLACSSVAAKHVLGFRPHVEQVAGALGLFQGYLIEMATGEGKTLTVALAAALRGFTRLPCHVVTSNDYLAERDGIELAKYYGYFGLKVAAVTSEMNSEGRQKAYEADVVYTTPKELLADFLRDRLILGQPYDPARRHLRRVVGVVQQEKGIVMRGLHCAIIDEADSVLIDEAVTPLIISRPTEDRQLMESTLMAQKWINPLQPDVDYEVDFQFRDIIVPEKTVQAFDEMIKRLPPGWRNRERLKELLKTALVAREHYRKGIHYVVDDGKIHLIDEFTGRIMAHRTWQQGLHQAVEAKEGLEISPPNETAASMSFQRFFRCFPVLAGLSGTAKESKSELWQIYHLPVLTLPTHRPVQRIVHPLAVFGSAELKWKEVIAEIRKVYQMGRPILVGTGSVKASEELASLLEKERIPFRLLNAVRHAQEAEIISQAGQTGKVTIATNMAGRGTDIKLEPGVIERGGLHVIATECFESGRVDRQLMGRAGRQGDPGSVRFILSLEDDLLKKYIPGPMRQMLRRMLQAEGKASKVLEGAYSLAQNAAERMSRRARKRLLKEDHWLEETLAQDGIAPGE